MVSVHVQNVVSQILLYLTVAFFSAACEIQRAKKLNMRAIIPGLVCQFLLMPFIGWCVVKICQPEPIIGVFVLIITSSPGGAFSNWWCSLFNADLTLSVLLTTCSSCACIGMLPANLLLYVKSTYHRTVSIDWARLTTTLAVIVAAVISGLGFRYWKRREDWVPRYATRIGTVAGLGLVFFSTFVTSGESEAPIFGNPWHFYVSIMTPGLIGFLMGLAVASVPALRLAKPTRVAIAVETCFQNVGIAIAAALNIFQGTDTAWGVRASLLYGLTMALVLFFGLILCWKAGWTLAPPSDSFFKVLLTEYQHRFELIEEHEGRESADGHAELNNISSEDNLIQGGEVSELTSGVTPQSPTATSQESAALSLGEESLQLQPDKITLAVVSGQQRPSNP